MPRIDIIYARTLEALETAVAAFLESELGRGWEPSGGPVQDRDGCRWAWAVRKQRADLPQGEVSLRERRR